MCSGKCKRDKTVSDEKPNRLLVSGFTVTAYIFLMEVNYITSWTFLYIRFSIMSHGCWDRMCISVCLLATVRTLFSAVSSNYWWGRVCQFWGDATQLVRSVSRQLGSEMSPATHRNERGFSYSIHSLTGDLKESWGSSVSFDPTLICQSVCVLIFVHHHVFHCSFVTHQLKYESALLLQ